MVWGLLIQVAGLTTVGFSIFVFPIPRPLPVNQPQIQSKILCQVCVWDFATESSSPPLMPFNKSEWWWVGGVGVGMGMGDGGWGWDGWVGGWVGWQYSNACLDFLQFSYYWSMVLCLPLQVAGLDSAGFSSFSVSNS